MSTAYPENILIVGAGPVGLTAALELSRRGHKVRVIDKGADFTPMAQSRALGVNNRTLQLLAQSGVADRLLEMGNEVSQFRILNEQEREVIRFDFLKSGFMHPFMLVVPQGRTERLLAEALKQYGVDVEWGAEVIASNEDTARPSVDIKCGTNVETVMPDILIGADGAGSFIRMTFGFSFEGEGYPAEFGLIDLEFEEPINAHEGVIRFTNGGTLGCIPISQHVARYISPRPDMLNVLLKNLDNYKVVWKSSFHISFRHVERLQRGVVFLAGDAAHIHSPAGTRGMNLGIEDACWLAYAIDENKTSDYSAWRLPEIRKVLEQTKTQTDGLVHMNAFGRFLRDHVASSLLKIPALKRAGLNQPRWA